MDKLIKQYCDEMRKAGYTCRDEMVKELISMPSSKWGFKYSDTEINVASRILNEA